MTEKQERKVIIQLQKRGILERKIRANKKLLLDIKGLLKTETNHNIRIEAENKEIIGQNLVNEQEKELEEKFSRLAIAHKAKVNYMEIWEIDMREPNNWREQR